MTLIAGCGEPTTPGQDVTFDMNGDGKDDIFYEDTKDGYYEIRDRNFDGRTDESTFYKLEGLVQFSRSDDDYDGVMETVTEFRDGHVTRVFVDTNRNNLYDIAFIYERDLIKATRYYPTKADEPEARIGEVIFDQYGYPGPEVFRETSLSEGEFHDHLGARVLLTR